MLNGGGAHHDVAGFESTRRRKEIPVSSIRDHCLGPVDAVINEVELAIGRGASQGNKRAFESVDRSDRLPFVHALGQAIKSSVRLKIGGWLRVLGGSTVGAGNIRAIALFSSARVYLTNGTLGHARVSSDHRR